MTITIAYPSEFFRNEVAVAAQEMFGRPLDLKIEFYLVNLLCNFMATSKVQTGQGEIDAFDTPLVFMLQRALEASIDDQIKIYKCLGDTSLFFAGYFKAFLRRKHIDQQYCITMGATAYESLAHIMRVLHRDDDFTQIYLELARGFADLVKLFERVSPEGKKQVAAIKTWAHSA